MRLFFDVEYGVKSGSGDLRRPLEAESCFDVFLFTPSSFLRFVCLS